MGATGDGQTQRLGLYCCCGSKGLEHEVGGGKELLSPDSGAGWGRSSGQRKEEALGWSDRKKGMDWIGSGENKEGGWLVRR